GNWPRVLHRLPDGNSFYSGDLPQDLCFDDSRFEMLWAMHPTEYHVIMIHGKPVKTPRWQQAYGDDYHYTGRVNKALPIPLLLEPLLAWARASIDPRLSGALLNWYSG